MREPGIPALPGDEDDDRSLVVPLSPSEDDSGEPLVLPYLQFSPDQLAELGKGAKVTIRQTEPPSYKRAGILIYDSSGKSMIIRVVEHEMTNDENHLVTYQQQSQILG